MFINTYAALRSLCPSICLADVSRAHSFIHLLNSPTQPPALSLHLTIHPSNRSYFCIFQTDLKHLSQQWLNSFISLHHSDVLTGQLEVEVLYPPSDGTSKNVCFGSSDSSPPLYRHSIPDIRCGNTGLYNIFTWLFLSLSLQKPCGTFCLLFLCEYEKTC